MRPHLVLDIETVPTDAALAMPYPAADRQPPANYKSDDAIAAWRERDQADWERDRIKACSVNPRLGRIICIGYKLVSNAAPSAPDDQLTLDAAVADETQMLTAFAADNEPAILRTIWRKIAQVDGNVVTWNGGWDLRFIVTRSLIHGIPLPPDALEFMDDWHRPYITYSSIPSHIDCKLWLVGSGIVKGEGLDEWATAFGLPGKTDGLTGADVWPMYQAGRYDDIEAYCAKDVDATAAIFQRIAHCFGFME